MIGGSVIGGSVIRGSVIRGSVGTVELCLQSGMVYPQPHPFIKPLHDPSRTPV